MVSLTCATISVAVHAVHVKARRALATILHFMNETHAWRIFTIKIILQVKSFKSNWGYLSLAKSVTLVLPTFSSHSQAL